METVMEFKLLVKVDRDIRIILLILGNRIMGKIHMGQEETPIQMDLILKCLGQVFSRYFQGPEETQIRDRESENLCLQEIKIM
jgi:hypothetical protein